MRKSLTERLTTPQHLKLNKLITRLARESRDGQIPDGVDIDLYRTYERVRETFFNDDGKSYRDGVSKQRSQRGIKHAWELIVKIGLYDSMLREGRKK